MSSTHQERNRQVSLTLTEREHAALRNKAGRRGMSMSALLRSEVVYPIDDQD